MVQAEGEPTSPAKLSGACTVAGSGRGGGRTRRTATSAAYEAPARPATGGVMSAPHGSPARSSWESAPLAALEHGVPFADRHIGPDAAGLARMLETIGVGSLEELADTAMPSSIRTDPADWSDDPTGHAPPPPATEAQVLDELRGMAARNTTLEPMLGLGYHGTLTPPVIRRNVL